jgi:glucose-6-phosphate isomerase
MATSMKISFDYNNAMTSIAGEEHGITEKELEALKPKAKAIHEDLMRLRKEEVAGFFDLPYNTMLVQAINAISMEIRRNFENFVIVGIGGSSLGPKFLHKSLNHSYHEFLPPPKRRIKPRIFYMDNPDPEAVKDLLDVLDLRSTAFNIISKSGGTAETMSIFMHIYNVVQRRFSKSALSKHFLVTTDPEKGMLREVAITDKLKTLPIPENVGGRFSIFSPVGLLPAAVSGINIKELLAGAAAMDKKCQEADLMKNPAYLNAAIHYLAHKKKGKNISVMMPYCNSLDYFADWYVQLWAESLGKQFDNDGNIVETGQTPLKALGAIDQHSKMQLFIEGPNDKIHTLIGVKKSKRECKVPRVFPAIEAINHLAESELGVLLNNELLATEFALARHNRPSVKIMLDEINPTNIGGLLYLYEVQTAFAAGLYNINAFDQPGVEDGKLVTHALMGRKSKEDKAIMKEVRLYKKEKKKYKCL